MKAVKLTLVELDNPPYVYVEDNANLDEDGEGVLYTVSEFCDAVTTKGKLTEKVAASLLAYLKSGILDTERDVKHLERAYNIAHGLA